MLKGTIIVEDKKSLHDGCDFNLIAARATYNAVLHCAKQLK